LGWGKRPKHTCARGFDIGAISRAFNRGFLAGFSGLGRAARLPRRAMVGFSNPKTLKTRAAYCMQAQQWKRRDCMNRLANIIVRLSRSDSFPSVESLEDIPAHPKNVDWIVDRVLKRLESNG